MTPESKGAWMRRLIIISLIGAAAAAGLVFKPKDKKNDGVVSTAVKVTFQNYKEVYGKPAVLTVSNLRVEGNAAADKLQEILEKLKKDKYGPKIQLAEVDVAVEKGLAGMAGVDPAKLAGHLEFYSESKKMGDLVGQNDPRVVEQTIDNILNGMLQRMSKDWKPDVEGMKSGNATGVPGMSRDNGKQLPPSFKPAPAQAPAPAPAPAVAGKKEKLDHK
ncbi:hypothetical protein [Haloferula sp. BvORR071]|uniref:hypothetical protein n=1 Tax=Haloferula sp. BvORR071 TaxID=1396141 RepID=UPI000552ACF7|nr:hypothetical protein [Haloferula sp. BvORR071]